MTPASTPETSGAPVLNARTMSTALISQSRSLLVACVALACCVTCAKPKPPTITPRAVQLSSVGPNGVQLSVTLDVANPNRFPLIARSVDGRFFLGASGAAGRGVEFGKAHAEPASSIPAEGTGTVTSDLAVSWNDLSALAPFLLSATVPYRFEGNATLGGESLNISLPFTLNGELTRAQLLSAGLSGLGPGGAR